MSTQATFPEPVPSRTLPPEPEERPALRRAGLSLRQWAGFLLGLAVSGLFVWLALRGVSWNGVVDALRGANLPILAMAVAVLTASTVIRAFRWGAMLGNKPPVRLRYLYTSMMIGYLANNVLPARMGELVRIYVLQRKAGVGKSTSAATVILERLLDALLLLGILSLLVPLVALPAVIRGASPLVLGGFLGVVAFVLVLAFWGEPAARCVARLVQPLSRKAARRLQDMLSRFVIGLEVLRSPRQGLTVLSLTALIWAGEASSVWLIMRAMHLELPWLAALFVLGVVSLSFLIPAAPGAVGTYEFFAVAALGPFDVSGSQALSLALVLHAAGYLMATVVGLASLWIEGLSFRKLISEKPYPQQESA